MYTKFCQNRLGFVEDMTKTFWCVFFGPQCSYKTALTGSRIRLSVNTIVDDVEV